MHYVIEAHWFWNAELKGLLLVGGERDYDEDRRTIWLGWESRESKQQQKEWDEWREADLAESARKIAEYQKING